MSSSKGYIDAGKDFLLVSPRLCLILYNRQCSCYKVRLSKFSINFLFFFFPKEPIVNISSSYSNGLLSKHSDNLKSSCKSGDIHCQFSIKFNHQKYIEKPNQCECNGQFQFDIDHCKRLMDKFH